MKFLTIVAVTFGFSTLSAWAAVSDRSTQEIVQKAGTKYPRVIQVKPLIRAQSIKAKGDGTPESHDGAVVADHLIVVTAPGVTENQLKAAVQKLGMSLRKRAVDGAYYLVSFAAQAPEDLDRARAQLQSLKSLVTKVQVDRLVHVERATSDTYFDNEYGLGQISAPQAWDTSTCSPSVIVGVIDTGIDYYHEDLAANMWRNAGEIPGNGIDDDGDGYVDDVFGANFYAGTGDPKDDYYHGTHVAGTIAALGDNNTGVSGVCWHARLMALKFLDSNGDGYTSDAIDAVRYGVNHGAKILNNSWSGVSYADEDALKDAISYANANNVLFVAAAGNSKLDNDSELTLPASYDLPNIISVAASDGNDSIVNVSGGWGSNYGDLTVHLAAPGYNILSTLPGYSTAAMIDAGLDPYYGRLSGTSMATPHVSGAAALLLSVNPRLTAQQLRTKLLNGVDTQVSMRDMLISSGRLNVAKALSATSNRIVPGQPTNVKVTATQTSLRFNWTPGTNAFTSKVALTANKTAVACRSAYTKLGTEAEWDDLKVDTAYIFTVCSRNADGDFSPILTMNVRTSSAPTAAVPVIDSFLRVDDHTLRLKFHGTNDATQGFVIGYKRSGSLADITCSTANGAAVLNVDKSTTTQTLSNLKAGYNYLVAVCAKNAAGKLSEPVKARASTVATQEAVPPPVVGLVRTAGNRVSLTAGWKSGGGSTVEYVVAINKGSVKNVNCTQVNAVREPGLSHVFKGLKSNTTYAIAVCAVNSKGQLSGLSRFGTATKK